jgi:hypothetical protein
MITIIVKVCGDYWDNPAEVNKLLEQTAGKWPVMLDLQAEGPSLRSLGVVETIDCYCKKYQVDPKNIFITGWSNGAESVDYSLTHPHYLSHFFDYSRRYWIKNLPENTHECVFGFFIGRRAIPRAIIMHYLYHTYGSKNLLSCLLADMDQPWRNPGNGVNLEQLSNWMPEDQQPEFIKWWDTDLISSLDNHCISDQYQPEINTNYDLVKHYHRFDIELVAESYTRGETFFPTEKTVRPIMAAKPMIVYGPARFMERLRLLGFETYSECWDESYDQLEGPVRWQAIRKLVDSIVQMDTDSRRNLIAGSSKIAQRNRQHLAKIIKLNDT